MATTRNINAKRNMFQTSSWNNPTNAAYETAFRSHHARHPATRVMSHIFMDSKAGAFGVPVALGYPFVRATSGLQARA
jgi:hypothetical protein